MKLILEAIIIGTVILGGAVVKANDSASSTAALSSHPTQFRHWTQYGDYSELGDGRLRAYFSATIRGWPRALGIELTANVFQNLPTAPSDGRWDVLDANGDVVHFCCGHERVLDLPDEASWTPFEHIVVNYNPNGHAPPAIYDLQHFDFHFYLIDDAQRQSIAAPLAEERCEVPGPDSAPVLAPLTCEDFERAVAPLPSDMHPPGYTTVGAVEPAMGNHMVDFDSPEFGDETFTRTWIYGTWDGKLSFFEPMVTRQHLLDLQRRECASYPLPRAMPEAGLYPTRYCLEHRPWEGRYRVSLERWRYFPASSSGS